MLGVAGRSLGRAGLADFSTEQVRFLTYGRVIDTTRIAEQLGFHSQWSTVEAFEELMRGHGLTSLIPRGRESHDEARVVG